MSGTEFYSPLGASERILASGRPLAEREFVELSEEDQKKPHNARLIEEGHLIPVVHIQQTQDELQSQAAALDVKGRSNMNKDQLREAINQKLAEDAAAATERANAKESNQ